MPFYPFSNIPSQEPDKLAHFKIENFKHIDDKVSVFTQLALSRNWKKLKHPNDKIPVFTQIVHFKIANLEHPNEKVSVFTQLALSRTRKNSNAKFLSFTQLC